jgi:hypothetical protein
VLGFICGVLENAVKGYTDAKADIKGEEVRERELHNCGYLRGGSYVYKQPKWRKWQTDG